MIPQYAIMVKISYILRFVFICYYTKYIILKLPIIHWLSNSNSKKVWQLFPNQEDLPMKGIITWSFSEPWLNFTLYLTVIQWLRKPVTGTKEDAQWDSISVDQTSTEGRNQFFSGCLSNHSTSARTCHFLSFPIIFTNMSCLKSLSCKVYLHYQTTLLLNISFLSTWLLSRLVQAALHWLSFEEPENPGHWEGPLFSTGRVLATPRKRCMGSIKTNLTAS